MSLATRRLFAACLVLMVAADRAYCADEPAAAKPDAAAPAVELNEREQAFFDLMQDSTLVGHFSVDGTDENARARTDRYRINGVTKVQDDDWLVHARVVYGDFDVVVPVPVKMHWAGETAVLSVTDLTLPVLGAGFSSRLLFHGVRYAGTWGHGDVGGHMWGKLEKQSDAVDAKPGEK